MRARIVEDGKKPASFIRKALQDGGSALVGCGLGLSIAKWIASAHRGTIETSSVPAELTTVSVRLPATDPKP